MYILMKDGNTYNTPRKQFICDKEIDKDSIPLNDVMMGSKCYVIETDTSYILNSTGTWVEQTNAGGF